VQYLEPLVKKYKDERDDFEALLTRERLESQQAIAELEGEIRSLQDELEREKEARVAEVAALKRAHWMECEELQKSHEKAALKLCEQHSAEVQRKQDTFTAEKVALQKLIEAGEDRLEVLREEARLQKLQHQSREAELSDKITAGEITLDRVNKQLLEEQEKVHAAIAKKKNAVSIKESEINFLMRSHKEVERSFDEMTEEEKKAHLQAVKLYQATIASLDSTQKEYDQRIEMMEGAHAVVSEKQKGDVRRIAEKCDSITAEVKSAEQTASLLKPFKPQCAVLKDEVAGLDIKLDAERKAKSQLQEQFETQVHETAKSQLEAQEAQQLYDELKLICGTWEANAKEFHGLVHRECQQTGHRRKAELSRWPAGSSIHVALSQDYAQLEASYKKIIDAVQSKFPAEGMISARAAMVIAMKLYTRAVTFL